MVEITDGNALLSGEHLRALQKKLEELPEDHLSREIIKPLYEAMGYEWVEFVGGSDEKGIDVVAWRTRDFKEKEITVVQVKKVKKSRRASDPSSFPGLVPQLYQLADNPIVLPDGSKNKPDRVIFISPSLISVRALRANLGGYRRLREIRVKVVGGRMLAEAVAEHLPRQAWRLLGPVIAIEQLAMATIKNDPLMRALDVSRTMDLLSVYTDLPYTIGGSMVWGLLQSDFKPRTMKNVKVSIKEWKQIFEAAKILEELNVNILQDKPESYQERVRYLVGVEEMRVEENKTRIDQIGTDLRNLYTAKMELERNIDDAEAHMERTNPRLRELKQEKTKLKKVIQKIKRERQETLEYESRPAPDLNLSKTEDEDLIFAKKKLKATQSEIDAELSALDILTSQIHEITSKIERLTHEKRSIETPQEIMLTLSLSGHGLVEFLTRERVRLTQTIEELNKGKVSTNDLETFIGDTYGCFIKIRKVLETDLIKESLGLVGDLLYFKSSAVPQIKLPISHLFNCKCNFILLGEAGGGKTTTLRVYVRRRTGSGPSIFVPLASLVKAWSDADGELAAASEHVLERGIEAYLRDSGIPAEGQLDAVFQNQGASVMLDGIDEVKKNAPWIVDVITSFAQKYPKVQVIASSRASTPGLERLGLFPILLLPFTEEQIRQYPLLWFKDSPDDVGAILRHLLVNPELAEVVRTPLLITILCVLQQHQIRLPENEIRLYEERMKLLVGDYYDTYKGIERRIESQRHDLHIAAIKLGYSLHQEGVRAATAERMVDWILPVFGSRLGVKDCMLLIEELRDPCHILFHMNPEGGLGFGHMRFQEYLAARELQENCPIDKVISLVESTWWRGVLTLFSQMCPSIDWIISQYEGPGMSETIRQTLNAMIKVRPQSEQRKLIDKLYRHTLFKPVS